jgi:hypothetical protein
MKNHYFLVLIIDDDLAPEHQTCIFDQLFAAFQLCQSGAASNLLEFLLVHCSTEFYTFFGSQCFFIVIMSKFAGSIPSSWCLLYVILHQKS